MTLPLVTLILLGFACALAGSVGGIGGATLLVPVLVVLDVEPLVAAPLGLVAVAAGSLASASRQIDDGLVHHRLGLTVELAASVGTVAGALASTLVPQRALQLILGVAAFIWFLNTFQECLDAPTQAEAQACVERKLGVQQPTAP